MFYEYDFYLRMLDVRLIRKNRRWELHEKTMFSNAETVDLTLMAPVNVNPQTLFQSCLTDFQGI